MILVTGCDIQTHKLVQSVLVSKLYTLSAWDASTLGKKGLEREGKEGGRDKGEGEAGEGGGRCLHVLQDIVK